MRVICQCVSIQRVAEVLVGDFGAVDQERVTVVLQPQYSTDPAHPNRQLWQRAPTGEVRLGFLPPAEAAPFELHRVYVVEINPAMWPGKET